MNSMFLVALLCAIGVAVAEDDGSWKGEGLLESQDYGQYNHPYPYYSPYYAAPVFARYYYGAAPLAADGRVVDTPEVAQAKAAHFAAHSAAAGGVVALTHDGKYLQDTPEVAQAKAAHFAAYNHAAYAAHAVPYAYYPYAPVELTPDGKYLKDTPEVAQAKAAHFAAHAAAH